MIKVRKQITPIQQVCLQRGQDERTIANSYCLVRFLKDNGQTVAALEVERAMRIAKQVSRDNYVNNRIWLDPDWLSKQVKEVGKNG